MQRNTREARASMFDGEISEESPQRLVADLREIRTLGRGSEFKG